MSERALTGFMIYDSSRFSVFNPDRKKRVSLVCFFVLLQCLVSIRTRGYWVPRPNTSLVGTLTCQWCPKSTFHDISRLKNLVIRRLEGLLSACLAWIFRVHFEKLPEIHVSTPSRDERAAADNGDVAPAFNVHSQCPNFRARTGSVSLLCRAIVSLDEDPISCSRRHQGGRRWRRRHQWTGGPIRLFNLWITLRDCYTSRNRHGQKSGYIPSSTEGSNLLHWLVHLSLLCVWHIHVPKYSHARMVDARLRTYRIQRWMRAR